jgi:hypothetical protein
MPTRVQVRGVIHETLEDQLGRPANLITWLTALDLAPLLFRAVRHCSATYASKDADGGREKPVGCEQAGRSQPVSNLQAAACVSA